MPLSRAGLQPSPGLLLLLLAAFSFVILIAGCDAGAPPPTATPIVPTNTPTSIPTDTPIPTATNTSTPVPTATNTPIPVAERMATYVPILCYHHIRDWVKSDTEDDRAYIAPIATFEKTLKFLKDQGYTGVDAHQVYDFYANGKPLPSKPIMLSFDDTDENQYTNGLPLLKQYGFTATFFIMTVSVNQDNYMTEDQIKDLDKQGFDIEPHTWDHHMVTGYKTDDDWQTQIVGPKKYLEQLLGHDTPFFAYPYGIYDAATAEKIKSYGYKAAFRLNEVMDDKTDPLFAIKRYIANPYFTDDQFQAVLDGTW